MKKLIALTLALVLVCSLLAGCGSSSSSSTSAAPAAPAQSSTQTSTSTAESAPKKDPIVIKFAHAVSPESHYQVGAEKFKELVEERTNGEILVEIYPSAQLGAEREALEAMTLGNIEVGICIDSVLAQSSGHPEFNVLLMPFLTGNTKELYALWDSDLISEMFEASKDFGVEVLTAYNNGYRNLSNSVRPIESIDDIKGLKVRTPESSLYIDTWNALGAAPSGLAWSEVYSALQTGVFDGQEAPTMVFYTDGIYETQKYVAMLNYMNDPLLVCASTQFMNSLTEEQQEIIRQAAVESAAVERAYLHRFGYDHGYHSHYHSDRSHFLSHWRLPGDPGTAVGRGDRCKPCLRHDHTSLWDQPVRCLRILKVSAAGDDQGRKMVLYHRVPAFDAGNILSLAVFVAH